LVPQYLEDQTTAEEIQKARLRIGTVSGYRPRGSGRPTKRERRVLDGISEVALDEGDAEDVETDGDESP
jgi:hypothetical protein